jgi:hypothetical protein
LVLPYAGDHRHISDAFWDAPLNPVRRARGGGNLPPGTAASRISLGLPCKPEEIHRADAVYQVTGRSVKTNGAHRGAFPA